MWAGAVASFSAIQWPQVDFRANQIRLHSADTKNEEPRTLPIYGEMREWLLLAKEIRDLRFPTCPWVFYDERGRRLYWFYEEWKLAREKAGVPDVLFHDLRRSAVRNMERAGIPRKVAMAISGHKTESIYRRYDIVAHRDLTDAAARMERYIETVKPAEKKPGTLSGTPNAEEDSECQTRKQQVLN